MIQLYSLMWVFALFFAFLGYLRGWNQELVSTGGILFALFAILQLDGYMRGLLFFSLPRDQLFLVQALLFLGVVILMYRAREVRGQARRATNNWGSAMLGGIVGFINGYLVGGSLWYLLDINEYPLTQFVIAPALNSPSGQNINWIPLVLIGGGASGTGDILAVAVIAMLFFIVVVF